MITRILRCRYEREPIRIGADAWICARTLYGRPGSAPVGEGAVVGAGAVAMEDVPAWQMVERSLPAKVVKEQKTRPQ